MTSLCARPDPARGDWPEHTPNLSLRTEFAGFTDRVDAAMFFGTTHYRWESKN